MKTIFISIASFRDVECSKTIDSLIENADNPGNLVLGILEQNSEDIFEKCTGNNVSAVKEVRKVSVDHLVASGPQTARATIFKLLGDEDYFLQIDSHCIFEKSWDTLLLEMYEREIQLRNINNMNTSFIISHYSPDINQRENIDHRLNVSRICSPGFSKSKKIFGLNKAKFVEQTEEEKNSFLKEVPYIGAGFVFGLSSVIKKVPYDPNLAGLFMGEEIAHAVRLWTSGVDILSPSQNVIFHYYVRKGQPRHHSDDTQALKIVQMLLSDTLPITYPYNLGKERSLLEYYEFIGVDWENKTLTRDFCNPTMKLDVSLEDLDMPQVIQYKNNPPIFSAYTYHKLNIFSCPMTHCQILMGFIILIVVVFILKCL